jgi:HK97 family phage major capsid protein
VPVTEFPAGGLGSAVTPEEWARYVLDHLSHASVVLASGATEIRTSAKQVHVPRILTNGTAAWYDELEPIAEGAPTGDELVLTPKKVATLANFSDEVVSDSSPSVLDTAGTAMTRAVALEADRAMFAGTGNKQPLGLLNLVPALPGFDGPPDYTGLVQGAGKVAAAGGSANVAYVNPADYTGLQLATDANDRPLISGDPTKGAPPVIAGLAIWPTPAVPAGTAIVAQADQIVVAVREDASVAVSEHALFASDGTVARVIARVDLGVNDPDGLCVVKDVAAATASAKK